MTFVFLRLPKRSFFFPLAFTEKTFGLTSSISRPSKGWEKESFMLTVLLSSCIIMESDGITMPKWAEAVFALKKMRVNKDIIEIILLHIIASLKSKKTTG